MQSVDSLIHSRWIVPVVPRDQVLEQHTLVVHGSKIIDIIPTHEVIGRYQAHHESHLQHHLLIPGFINAHTHVAMCLFRGLADDIPLKSWFEKHIRPLEKRWVDEAFVTDGTRLAICEMIRSGTTCFADSYLFPESTAEVAAEAGIRTKLSLIISDSATSYATEIDDYFSKALKLTDIYKHHPLINCQFLPHDPLSMSDETLYRVQILSTELGIPVQMSLHESLPELNVSLVPSRKRALQRLDELGLLSPDLQVVHMTNLSVDEIDLLANTGVQVIHCPESNMKLASGSCPVAALLKKGVNVALATDSAASNNDLDMLAEMKTAALLAKQIANDASAVSAMTALEMATINGAKALSLDSKVGSLEMGKQADFIAVDMSGLEQQPLYHPISQLVYTSDRTQITDLWVAGKHLMKNRQLTTLDLSSVLENTAHWQQQIIQQESR